jgi:molybdopterin-guanine dinucleotide biosynthesis protein A
MPERDDRLVAGALSPPLGEEAVLGIIFAGGASRRYGQDKMLASLDSIPLLQRVADRFGPQVDALTISGQHRSGFPIPNIPDRLNGAGPLAALCSVLEVAAQQNWSLVATVSGDTPFIPGDMVDRLVAALKGRDCAVASWRGVLQPTCTVWATHVCAEIKLMFDAGARSLHRVISRLDAAKVDFSAIGGGPGGDPFFNINSQKDMASAKAWLSERQRTE